MYRQGSISFIVATSLSLAVHATAVVYIEPYRSPEAAAPQSAPTLQLSLTAAQPAPPQAVPEPVPEPLPEPEPPPPPEIQPPPKPVAKPAPKPVVRPKPRPQPTPRKPPVTKVVETVQPIPAQLATRTEKIAEKPVLTQVPRVNERENYLAQLLAHVESHKFYPRSARRRGVIGDVQVSFYLLKDGTIRDLQITGDSKLLRKAARRAIQKALSLPRPPETLSLQDPIRFSMVYRLEG